MYTNNFLVSIKHNGRPLREIKNGDLTEAFLPFNSEYQVTLRNDRYVRARVDIYIDGTNVTDSGIIVNPHQTLDLERFITDGDLNKGNKFKFVSKKSGEVQDKGNNENGLVEVHVTYELPPPPIPAPIRIDLDNGIWNDELVVPVRKSSPQDYWTDNTSTSGTTYNNNIPLTGNISACCSNSETLGNTREFLSHDIYRKGTKDSQIGATVQGGESTQRFVETSLGALESTSTTFAIWLRGNQRTITTRSRLYCTNCSGPVKTTWKYCPTCSTAVEVV